jgi:hypothetical protein
MHDIQGCVNSIGYRIPVESPAQAWRYRLNHPRWLRCRENEVEVRLCDEHRIEIHGPKLALRTLRTRLSRLDGYVTTDDAAHKS